MHFFNADWNFYNPVKIYSGSGTRRKLPLLLPEGNGLLVTSPGFTARGVTAEMQALLAGRELLIIDDVCPNPELETIEAYRQHFIGRELNFIVALGGGSVIDTAKVLSYLLISGSDFTLHGHFKEQEPLPQLSPLMLAVLPSTAGTGSEVTPFATVWDRKEGKKYSLAAPNLFPVATFLDPQLTLSLPLEVTIYSGLDVLSHSLESIWNRNANPITMSYAVQAVDIVLKTLPLLVKDLDKIDYRARMLTASLFGGLAISSTRTALAHSMSYPITISFGMPHGLACGFTLPVLLGFNALADDGRIALAVRQLGFSDTAELKEHLKRFFQDLGVGNLMKKYGINKADLLDLAPQMFTPERADNNLRAVDLEQVRAILSEAMESF